MQSLVNFVNRENFPKRVTDVASDSDRLEFLERLPAFVAEPDRLARGRSKYTPLLRVVRLAVWTANR